MKTTLHLALSADGFIAKPDGDSDWVSPIDSELFESRVKDAGCIIVGRKTFEQYKGELYPVEGVVNIVVTSDVDYKRDDVMVASSPVVAVALAEEKGCTKILLAGGGRTSAAFLQAGLIDEIFFSVHPLILGQGIKPFEGKTFEKNLKLLDSRDLGEGLVELCYEVIH